MRIRLKTAVIVVLFAAAPLHAAGVVRSTPWQQRLPALMQRLLQFTPRSNGDHLSPPLPKPIACTSGTCTQRTTS
jgi:hypothetical protein